MELIIEQIFTYLWQQSWHLTLLVIFIAGTTWLLRKQSAHIRYLLWLIVLAKCIVPSFVTIPLAVLPDTSNVTTVILSDSQTVDPPPLFVPQEVITILPVTPKHSHTLWQLLMEHWRLALLLTWALGATLLILWTFIRSLQLHVRLRKHRHPLTKKEKQSIQKLFQRCNINRLPKVWLLAHSNQPFVWGLLRGDIYLPENLMNTNATELTSILAHEYSHIQRKDAGFNLIQTLIQILYWFHPCVWWANHRIRAEREKCCDEMALSLIQSSPKQYGRSILNTLMREHHASSPVSSLAVSGSAKNIEDRIKTVLEPGRQFLQKPGLTTLTMSLLLAILILPTSVALTKSENTSSHTSIKVPHDNKPAPPHNEIVSVVEQPEIIPTVDINNVISSPPITQLLATPIHTPSLFERGKQLYEENKGQWQNQSVNQAAYSLLDDDRLPYFKDLLDSKNLADNNDWAYFQAGAFVKYLTNYCSEVKENRNMTYHQIRHLRSASDIPRFDPVIKELSGYTFKQLEKHWHRYLRDHAWLQVLLDARIISVDNKAKEFYEWREKQVMEALLSPTDLQELDKIIQSSDKIKIVSHPQVMAQMCNPAEIRVVREEYFMLTPASGKNNPAELERIDSGFSLTCTPRIQGNTKNIAIEYNIEISDSFPAQKKRKGDLPIVIRNTQKGLFAVQPGTAFMAACGNNNGQPTFICIKATLLNRQDTKEQTPPKPASKIPGLFKKYKRYPSH